MSNKSQKKLVWNLILVSLLVFGVVFFADAYWVRLSFVERHLDKLTEFQKVQLELFVERNKLLIWLSSLVFGVIGFVLFKILGTKGSSPELRWLAVGAWLFAGLSIFFGYYSLGSLMWMMSERFFNLYSKPVEWASSFQFGSLLVSLIFLATFMLRTFNVSEESHNSEQED